MARSLCEFGADQLVEADCSRGIGQIRHAGRLESRQLHRLRQVGGNVKHRSDPRRPIARSTSVVSDRQDLDLPAPFAIDDREGKSPQRNAAKIWLALDPELLRIAAHALHRRTETRQIARAEPLAPAFVEGNLRQVFGFGAWVKEVFHRRIERAFFSTSSDGINCTAPESTCSARRWASANQTRSRSDTDNSSRLESRSSAKRARSSGGSPSTSFSSESIVIDSRYHG